MTWIVIGLVAWLLASPIVSIAVGRAVTLAEAKRVH